MLTVMCGSFVLLTPCFALIFFFSFLEVLRVPDVFHSLANKGVANVPFFKQTSENGEKVKERRKITLEWFERNCIEKGTNLFTVIVVSVANFVFRVNSVARTFFLTNN